MTKEIVPTKNDSIEKNSTILPNIDEEMSSSICIEDYQDLNKFYSRFLEPDSKDDSSLLKNDSDIFFPSSDPISKHFKGRVRRII
jgi:hypothetical protein